MSTDGCLPATGPTPGLGTEQGVWPRANDRGSPERWHSASRRAQLWWGLVGFAGIDVVYAPPALTGAWWCAYLVLWITPWGKVPTPKNSLAAWLNWLSVTLLVSWLAYRTLGALLEASSGWILTTSLPKLNLLSYPAQTVFTSFIAALLLARPLHRIAGKHAVTIGLAAALPYGLVLGGSDLLSLSRWLNKTLANSLILFDCLFPMLMIAEGAALHRRYFDRRDEQSRLRKPWSIRAVLSRRINASPTLLLCAAALAAVVGGQTWLKSFDLTHAGPIELLTYASVFPLTAVLFLLSAATAWRSLVSARRQRGRALRLVITSLQGSLVIAIAVVLLRGIFREAPISGQLVSEAIELAAGPAWRIEPTGTPGELRVRGDFQRGMSAGLAAQLAATPDVLRIELDSAGGSIQAGYAVARLIEEWRLETFVKTECASACTLAFAAGVERILGPGAKLGFHSFEFALWSSTHDPFVEYFEQRGVDPEFARRGFDVPFEDVWYPDATELVSAGIVTTVLPDVSND